MDKLEVARQQLLTALDLFLLDYSSVSVHSLAGNAREILDRLCERSGKPRFVEHALAQRETKRVQDIYRIINAY